MEPQPDGLAAKAPEPRTVRIIFEFLSLGPHGEKSNAWASSQSRTLGISQATASRFCSPLAHTSPWDFHSGKTAPTSVSSSSVLHEWWTGNTRILEGQSVPVWISTRQKRRYDDAGFSKQKQHESSTVYIPCQNVLISKRFPNRLCHSTVLLCMKMESQGSTHHRTNLLLDQTLQHICTGLKHALLKTLWAGRGIPRYQLIKATAHELDDQCTHSRTTFIGIKTSRKVRLNFTFQKIRKKIL